MKKTLSVILSILFIAAALCSCSSSTAMTEDNITKTVNTAFDALKNFDTDTLQKYVDSSTLTTIVGYAEQHEQIAELGKIIFENLTVEVKSIDLEKKTVTVSVKNKDLANSAKDFAQGLKNDYSTFQLLAKLSDETFLDSRLSTLKDVISKCKMQEDPTEITLNVTQGSKNLILTFDETAENAVSGGALSAIKEIFVG